MKHAGRIIVVIAVFIMCAGGAYAGTITGKVKAHGARNSADAVVYISKIPGKTFPAPKEHARITQKGLRFHPHILPILVGTTVDFLNDDDVLHNVFSPDACAGKFNLGTWPKGQIRSYTFTKSDCQAVILCNVHPEMEAYAVVLETPYFAVTSDDGKYEINNVPPGKYSLHIWHEKLKGKPQDVTVPEHGEVEVNFEIRR